VTSRVDYADANRDTEADARNAAEARRDDPTPDSTRADAARGQRRVLMLLGNAFDPDVRVYSEARSLVAAGYSVRILAWDRDRRLPTTDVIDGIDVERIRVRSTHGRGAVQAYYTGLVSLAMVTRAARLTFDVIHAHDMDTLSAGYLIALRTGKPLIYDSHEDYAGMLHGTIPGWMEHVIRRLETILVRRIDLLITVGETLRRQFEARGCRQCLVIGNWKRLSEYRPDAEVRRRVRRELAIPDNAVVVVYIANLGRERRIAELLEAVRDRPDVHLVIGGTGFQEQAVRHAATASRNIHYLGFVKPGDVPAYTVASDVVYYGFDVTNPNARYSAPNKLFEALAAGCCIVSGHFGEIQHVVAEYDCGILVDHFTVGQLGRALDACRDPQRLSRWKQNAARAGAERYSWERAEQLLLLAYQHMLRTSTAPVS
jgi:glycosyltransferase involved in cell wall biosynthesis